METLESRNNFPCRWGCSASGRLLLTFAFCSPTIEAVEETRRRAQVRRSVTSGDWGKDWTWSLPMAEGGLLSSYIWCFLQAGWQITEGDASRAAWRSKSAPPWRGEIATP